MNQAVTQIFERRKHPRVPIKGRGDAMVFGPELAKGIQILDLSRGGVAFRYVAGYEQLVEPLELDILWNHLGVFLLKLKLRVVSDVQVPNEYLLGVIPVRRCGAEFVDLTEDQAAQLNHFIENHSTDEVELHPPLSANHAMMCKEAQEQWNDL
jgi:hypothetical protein